jgi:hypothetical protein
MSVPVSVTVTLPVPVPMPMTVPVSLPGPSRRRGLSVCPLAFPVRLIWLLPLFSGSCLSLCLENRLPLTQT